MHVHESIHQTVTLPNITTLYTNGILRLVVREDKAGIGGAPMPLNPVHGNFQVHIPLSTRRYFRNILRKRNGTRLYVSFALVGNSDEIFTRSGHF